MATYSRIVACLQGMMESPNAVQFSEVLIRSTIEMFRGESPSDVMQKVLVEMVREFPIEEAFVDELTKYLYML